MNNAVQETIDQDFSPGKTIPFTEWKSLPKDKRDQIDADLNDQGLKRLSIEEGEFYVICYGTDENPEEDQEEEEYQPLTVEDLQEILNKHLKGDEITIEVSPTYNSKMVRFSKPIEFSASPKEDLGERISNALRCIAKQFLAVSQVIDEAMGYDCDPAQMFYVANPLGHEVCMHITEDVSFQVLNAKSEEDAIGKVQKTLELINGGNRLPPVRARNQDPVRLTHVNTSIFEFTHEGIFGTALEGCRITVEGESNRPAAERQALAFIRYLQALPQSQAEPTRLTA